MKTAGQSPLADVCALITRGISPAYDDAGIPVLSQKCVRENRVIFEAARTTNPETRKVPRDKLVQLGDVLVNSTGVGTLGRVAQVRHLVGEVTVDSHVSIVRPDPDKIDPRFFGYAMVLSQPKIEAMGEGATGQTELSRRRLCEEVLIPRPPRSVQRRIAAILSAYDDLIENNQRRIQILEEMARRLYREWFVALRFPGSKGVRIADGVPEGWERRRVDEVTSFLNRGIAPRYDDDADGLVINQKCIRSGRLDLAQARHQSQEFKLERQVQPGDVLVNSTGEGTIGRVAQVLAPVANCTVDTHVTIVRPMAVVGFHYFGRALMEMETRFSTMGRGATNQTELSRSQIGEVVILVPPTTLVRRFEDFTRPCFSQVATLVERNENLRLTRDLLLPRLMSGQIRLDEAAA
jgi:type I restriction enzyme S subunit